jgi:hypothetical protein
MDSIARRTKAPEMNRCFLVLIFVVEMVWGASTPPLSTAAQVKNHWAFQAVKPPVLPNVSGAKWPRTPVDRFVLAGLEAWGRVPSPRADRRTLIRRASFDLTVAFRTPPGMRINVIEQHCVQIGKHLGQPIFGDSLTPEMHFF